VAIVSAHFLSLVLIGGQEGIRPVKSCSSAEVVLCLSTMSQRCPPFHLKNKYPILVILVHVKYGDKVTSTGYRFVHLTSRL